MKGRGRTSAVLLWALLSVIFSLSNGQTLLNTYIKSPAPVGCEPQYKAFEHTSSDVITKSIIHEDNLLIFAGVGKGRICLSDTIPCYVTTNLGGAGFVFAQRPGAAPVRFSLEFSCSDTGAKVRVTDLVVAGQTLFIAGGYTGCTVDCHLVIVVHQGSSPNQQGVTVPTTTAGVWFLASIHLDGSNADIVREFVFSSEAASGSTLGDLKLAAISDSVRMCGSVMPGTELVDPCPCCETGGQLARLCLTKDLSGPAEVVDTTCGGEVVGDLTSNLVDTYYIAEMTSSAMSVHDFDGNEVDFMLSDPPRPTALAFNPVTEELILGCVYTDPFSVPGVTLPNPLGTNGAIIHLAISDLGVLSSRLGYPIESFNVTTISAITPDGEGNFYFGGAAIAPTAGVCSVYNAFNLQFQGQCIAHPPSTRQVAFYGMVRGLIMNAIPSPPSPIFRAIGDHAADTLSTIDSGAVIGGIAVHVGRTNRATLAVNLLGGVTDLSFYNADAAPSCTFTLPDRSASSSALLLAPLTIPDLPTELPCTGTASQVGEFFTVGRNFPTGTQAVSVDRLFHLNTGTDSYTFSAGTFEGAATFGQLVGPIRVSSMAPRRKDIFLSVRDDPADKLVWFAHLGSSQEDILSDVSAEGGHVVISFYYTGIPLQEAQMATALEIGTWKSNGDFELNKCKLEQTLVEGHVVFIATFDSATGECEGVERTRSARACAFLPKVPYSLAISSRIYAYVSVEGSGVVNLFGADVTIFDTDCHTYILEFNTNLGGARAVEQVHIGSAVSFGLTTETAVTLLGLSADVSVGFSKYRVVRFSKITDPIAIDTSCIVGTSSNGVALGTDIVVDATEVYFSLDRNGAGAFSLLGSSSSMSDTYLARLPLTTPLICSVGVVADFDSLGIPPGSIRQLAVNPVSPDGVWAVIPATNTLAANPGNVDITPMSPLSYSAVYHMSRAGNLTVELILANPDMESIAYTTSMRLALGGNIETATAISEVSTFGTKVCETQPFMDQGGVWAMFDPDGPQVTNLPSSTPTPTGTPSPTGSVSPTGTSSLTPAPSEAATITPTPTGTPTMSGTPSSKPSATPSPTAKSSNSAVATQSSTRTPTGTPSASASSSGTSTSSTTGTPSGSQTASATESSSATASLTRTPSPSDTTTKSPTQTMSSTPSLTPSPSSSATSSRSPTQSSSVTSSGSLTTTATGTASITASVTASSTQSGTDTVTVSSSSTSTPSQSSSITGTSSPAASPLPSASSTSSASFTISMASTTSDTPTSTSSSSMSGSQSPSVTSSSSPTGSAAETESPSRTESPSVSIKASTTSTASAPKTSTPTGTSTMTRTATISSTGSPTPSQSSTMSSSETTSPTSTATPSGTASSSPTQSSSVSKTKSESASGTPPTMMSVRFATSSPSRQSASAIVAPPLPVSPSPSRILSVASLETTGDAPSLSSSRTRTIIPFVVVKSFSANPIDDETVSLGSEAVTGGFDCRLSPQERLIEGDNTGRFVCDNSETPFLEVSISGATELIVVRPGDEELINAARNQVLIASPVLDITTGTIYSGESVELCFALDESTYEDADPDEACLGFIDESEDPPEWKCQDFCLSTNSEGLFCGETDHFTNFAILLDGAGAGDSGRCSSSSEDWITGESWGDIILFIGAILTCCMIGLVVIIVGTFVKPLHTFIVGEETARLETLRDRQLQYSA